MGKATREEVIACYRHILGREPECEAAVSRWTNVDFWAMVHGISHSDEYRLQLSRASAPSLLKCMNENYLARDLPAETRASAMIYNYSSLRQDLAPHHLLTLLNHGLPVFAVAADHPEVLVKASLFDGVADEGEISLFVSYGGRRLAVLAFTIVEGCEFGLASGSVILISRIQGVRDAGEDVRGATLALGGVAPPLLLFAALEGIAGALGIKRALCVGASIQPSFRADLAPQFTEAYDDLLVTLGAERLPSGFYELRLPHVERPLQRVPTTHRARSRRRRATRAAIAAQAQARWASYLRQAELRSEAPAPNPEPVMQQLPAMRPWAIGRMQMLRAAAARLISRFSSAASQPGLSRFRRSIAASADPETLIARFPA